MKTISVYSGQHPDKNSLATFLFCLIASLKYMPNLGSNNLSKKLLDWNLIFLTPQSTIKKSKESYMDTDLNPLI